MKNKIIIVSSFLFSLIILLIVGIFLYNKFNVQKGLNISDGIKPPLEVDILKDEIKVGKALGIISSWKYNDGIATSSLVSAKIILEKEDAIAEVKSGDIVELSTKDFESSLSENIYEITYNAIDDEENVILPIDEFIDFNSQVINVPILRENLNKTLYYYVTVKIQDKGTIVYFFKV